MWQLCCCRKCTTVRSQLVFLHYICSFNKIHYVHRAFVRQQVIHRVEVHNNMLSLQRRQELLHAEAVAALAAAWWPYHDLAVPHDVLIVRRGERKEKGNAVGKRRRTTPLC